MLISKELFSAVMPHGENRIEDIQLHGNELSVLYRIGGWSYYNIHDVAHKVKEWALKNGYILNSGLQNSEGYKNRKAYAEAKKDGDSWLNSNKTTFLSESEPKAIFNTGQWILDQRNQNDN